MAVHDYIIRNAVIIDGSGTKADTVLKDIAIDGGKIVLIAANIVEQGRKELDAAGLIAAPGFIDEHAHNDGYIFHDNSNIYKLAQGITTEISGNCGEALAPVRYEFFDEILEYYRPYYPPDDFCSFITEKAFLGRIDAIPKGTNMGFLCAHGTLRMSAMGFSSEKASDYLMGMMKDMLTECMESGALGMSSGLVYSPGCFADSDEIEDLCKIVKKYGGVYTTHLRSEGYKLVEAVEEAINVARNTGVRVVISHLKVLGRNYRGLSERILEMIDNARGEGLEIFCDQYPYNQSSAVLHWVIPHEMTEGGFPEMCRRLKNLEDRQWIKDMFANRFGPWDNLMENITPAGIYILKSDAVPEASGKTLLEYSKKLNIDPYDALFDIIAENGADTIGAFDCMFDEDIEAIMHKDYISVCTDGIDVFPNEKAHPRLTGAFPRVLGRYVREKNTITLEEAIYKMTGLPAKVMNLSGKGLIKEGYDADICIFDKDAVIDRGTFEKFNQLPDGIEHVFVNGQLSYSKKQYTGAAAGKLIKKSKIIY